MKKKKILVFINYYGKKSETFISDELDFFSQQSKLDVEILHYGKDINEKNVKGLDMPASFIKRFLKNPSLLTLDYLKSLKYKNGQNASLGYLIDFFKKNQYDTIYCHFGTNGKLIAELKALGVIPKQTKLVVRFHGLDMLFKKYPVGYYDILNDYAEYVIVGSLYAKADLLKYKIRQEIIIKHPVGVKQRNITNDPVIKRNEKLNIISVGRLVDFKGHLEALEISKFLNDRKPNFKFTIIGSGDLLPQLNKKIKLDNLTNLVRIIPGLPHSQTLEFIKSSDIYLYAGKVDEFGRAETQGLANLEAMAFGCIIIAFNVGGVSDYVIDGETGYLIEPGNISKFVEKLEWIIVNISTDEISRIRENARQMVNNNYNQEKLNEKLLDILIN